MIKILLKTKRQTQNFRSKTETASPFEHSVSASEYDAPAEASILRTRHKPILGGELMFSRIDRSSLGLFVT